MLVLTRKSQERILIGDNIKITILRVKGNAVRVGIDAPADVRVVRGELNVREKSAGALVVPAPMAAVSSAAACTEPAPQENASDDSAESTVLRRRAPLADYLLAGSHAI